MASIRCYRELARLICVYKALDVVDDCIYDVGDCVVGFLSDGFLCGVLIWLIGVLLCGSLALSYLIHVAFLGGVVDGYVAVDTLGGEAWESFEVSTVDCRC